MSDEIRLPAVVVVEVSADEYRDSEGEAWPALRPDDTDCLCCGTGVGVVLTGDRDDPVWRSTWAVLLDGGPVVGFLCEDCSPVLSDVASAILGTVVPEATS